jgi:glycosyltransferase involved in cell wall biosynthesis
MKILHIISNLKKGGAQRLVIDIVNNIQPISNIKVQLISFNDENDYKFLTELINYKVIPSEVIPSLTGKSIIEVKELQEYIDEYEPDIIHSHLFKSEMVLAHISLSTKTKRVIHFHDNMHQFRDFQLKTLFNKPYLTDFFEKQIVLRSYLENTVALCISMDTEQFAIKVLPARIVKKSFHNAIDLNRFHPSKKQLKTKEICIIGSLTDKKGQELAINCIAELNSRGIDIHLNILGDGPNKSLLQNQIVELSLQKFVTIHGNVDYPEVFLQNSLIYLHTAIYEPFGLVLIEAMACGLPVICTDGKGNRDLIREGENGFMIWERNPKLLADKIELLLKNDLLRVKMGERARKFAQSFGIEKYADELIRIYKS